MKEKQPKGFEIFLGAGAGCNMNCRYCFAGHQDCSQTQANPYVNEEVLLDKISKKNIAPNSKIVIWGGEPLANEDALRAAIKFLRKHWAQTIQIPTNGFALNDEWIKFFNDNNIMISISHDGPGQKYRGYDFFQDESYINKLRQVKRFSSCHYVLHRYNTDIKAINRYFLDFSDRLGRCVGATGGLIRHTNPYTAEFIPRKSDGSLQKTCESAVYTVSEGLAGNNMQLNTWLLRKFGKYLRLALFGPREWSQPFCDSTKILCIGLDGKEFLCHAEAELLASKPEVVTTTEDNFKFSQMCLNCDMFQLCGGVCAAIPNDEYRKGNCEINKAWHSTLYAYTLKALEYLGEGKIKEIINGEGEHIG